MITVRGLLNILIAPLKNADRGARTFQDKLVLTIAGNLAISALGLVSGLLAARLLAPSERGELAAIQSWPLVIASLAMLGMPEAVIYYGSRTPEQAGRYLASSQLIILVSAILLGSAGWLLMPTLLDKQAQPVVAAAQIYLLVMLGIYLCVGMPLHVLRAVGAWRAWNVLRLIFPGAWMAVLIVGLVVPKWGDAVSVSRMFVLAQVACTIPMLLVIRHLVSGPRRPRMADTRPLLGFGLPTMLYVLPQEFNLRLDQLLLAAFFDPRPLGLYVVAVTWSMVTAPVLTAVGPVLFPHLSAMNVLDQQQTLHTLLTRLVLSTAGLTTVLFIATPFALPALFGDRYRAAVPAALVLVVAGAFATLNTSLEATLQGLGRPRSVMSSEFAGLVVTLALLAILLPLYGMIGAAIASLIAYGGITLLLLAIIRHSTMRDSNGEQGQRGV